MSGPNPPGSEGSDLPGQEPGDQPTSERSAAPDTGETEFYSQAYSAPESEQFTSGPYVPADSSLYDYDSYEPATELVDQEKPPRWPWVVGVAAIVAAIALVASVSVLVTRTDTDNLATPATSTTTAPPVQDEITTTTPPPPPPPPPTYRGAAAPTTGDRDGDAGAATSAAACHGRGATAATGRPLRPRRRPRRPRLPGHARSPTR